MHWDKTVARILFILSVVHYALAAPAMVRQISQDVDEDVRPASEKRENTGGTSPVDIELGTPHLQSDPSPTSGIQYGPLNWKDDPSSRLAHALNPEYYSVWRWLQTLPAKQSLPDPIPKAKFFSDALKKKLKIGAGLGAFAGVSAGLGYGVYKIISDSHEAQPAGRNLTNSDVVGRGISTHPRPLRKPVSRALAKLRNEELLSVLTRRALEGLD